MSVETTRTPLARPSEHTTREEPPVTPWGHVAGLALAMALLLGIVLTAFAWPNLNSAPRNLPVVVAGPPAAAEQLARTLAANAGEDAFEVTVVDDPAAAEQAVMERDAYGAIVLGQDGGEVFVAGATSPAVAQALTQLAGTIPEQAGGPFAVTDLVPLPPNDPRGVGLTSAVLPLVMGGILTGAGAALRVRGVGRQMVTVLSVATGAGLVLTAILQTWLGALAGSFWANAGVLALGIAAIGATLAGLNKLLGRAGLGLGAATMVLLGNPLSGVTSAPEMLPAGWGQLGQWLPPGATGTALRSVAWFDGAGSGSAFLVLGVWLVAGLALCLAPGRTGRDAAPQASPG